MRCDPSLLPYVFFEAILGSQETHISRYDWRALMHGCRSPVISLRNCNNHFVDTRSMRRMLGIICPLARANRKILPTCQGNMGWISLRHPLMQPRAPIVPISPPSVGPCRVVPQYQHGCFVRFDSPRLIAHCHDTQAPQLSIFSSPH